MAKLIFSFPMLALILLILIPSSGRAQTHYEPTRKWCVAKPSASDEILTANTKFACEQVEVGDNCDQVKPGESCFLPDTIKSHASVAMNYYYQSMGMHDWNCDFAGSGLITITDLSHGSCSYASNGFPRTMNNEA